MNLADRDEDGKLTEKEVLEFYEVMGGGMDAVVSLQFGDFGQNLFELLDTNRDGRLGTRELRNAWSRLAEHDDNHKGAISKDELPRQCQLTISAGAVRLFPTPSLSRPRFAGRECRARAWSNQRWPDRCGSARWTSTTTATCRRANSWAAPRTSPRSTPTATA